MGLRQAHFPLHDRRWTHRALRHRRAARSSCRFCLPGRTFLTCCVASLSVACRLGHRAQLGRSAMSNAACRQSRIASGAALPTQTGLLRPRISTTAPSRASSRNRWHASRLFTRRAHCPQDFFMHDPNADKLRRVKGEIEQVKTAMIQNLGAFPGMPHRVRVCVGLPYGATR